MADHSRPVLILGAGINGAALARELALNGVPLVVADAADAASGATAYSSRLIHGGLRYLEYGDFALVRESLAERTRLLRLAPQFVRPLRLFIPVENRLGGAWATLRRLLRGDGRGSATAAPPRRGLWLVRAGLWFYDRYARDQSLPRHRAFAAGDPAAVPVDRRQFRWQCAYYDAQIQFPERFVLALLEDARRAAARSGARFDVRTYCRARLDGETVTLTDLPGRHGRVSCAELAPNQARLTQPWHTEYVDSAIEELRPAAIVNATGAWVDGTLRTLQIPSRRLMGGTKGSHFVTYHAGLRKLLAGRGVYAEAPDGRPVFVLPWGQATLVGTTDLPFEGDPRDATATPHELQYLLAAVNDVLPGAELTPDDVDQHYSGVRPLPAADARTPAAITRRHGIVFHDDCPLPCWSLVGGKLTTCRQLAEEAADAVFTRLGMKRIAGSRDLPLPGGEAYPADEAALLATWNSVATERGVTVEQVRALWPLYGTRSDEVLAKLPAERRTDLLDGTHLPRELARWTIRHEWALTLDDLVERRLMLLYHQPLTAACLRQLAEVLTEERLLPAEEIETHVSATIDRLHTRYGKRVV